MKSFARLLLLPQWFLIDRGGNKSPGTISPSLPFQGKNWKMASKIRKRIHPPFPVDLVVRTSEQLKQRLKQGDGFFENITREGKVLYETGNTGMD